VVGVRIAAAARTAADIGLGLSPRLPGDRAYGLDALTVAELTRHLGAEVPGARVVEVAATRDRQTTDRARLTITWNEAGAAAGLPVTAFAKGTPSLASSRILNSAFGLCASEVLFYRDVYAEVPELTLHPYFGTIGRGGRFLLLLESRDDRTHFHTMAEEADLAHAEGIVVALARLHARFDSSPRFGSDLGWVRPYSQRPGQVLAPRVLAMAERRFHQKYDVPPAVRRVMALHVRHGAELAALWESLPPTLCHGDTHLGNTFRTDDGVSGLFDWQEVHRMNGLRDVAYFIASAFAPAERARHERDLLGLYLETAAEAGAGGSLPTSSRAWDMYRLLLIDAWRSIWASLALMPVQTDGLDELLIARHCAYLLELDVDQAVRSALGV
jgi:hypothetical protein